MHAAIPCLDDIADGLRAEPHLGRVERQGDAVAVFVGPQPVLLAPGPGRLAIWTRIAAIAAVGGLAAARAAMAYNAANYHRTGTAAAVSVALGAVLLGRSLDASGLRAPQIAVVLRQVEGQRRVFEAHMAGAAERTAGARPSQDGNRHLWA